MALLTATLLLALVCVGKLAAEEGGGLYLALPGENAGSVDLAMLEEAERERLLLTYEVASSQRAEALKSTHSITLIGTSCAYPAVTGYRILNGGFFTQNAQDIAGKHAVLNEASAHKMFGSVRVQGNVMTIDGEYYQVVGVIEDNDTDNLNVYIPVSVMRGQVSGILAKKGGEYAGTAMQLENELSTLGIRSDSYTLIDLDKLCEAAQKKFQVVGLVLMMGLLGLTVRALLRLLKRDIGIFRLRMEGWYPRELLRENPGLVFRPAGFIAGLAVCATGLLWLPSRILAIFLNWPNAYTLLDISPEMFTVKIQKLQHSLLASEILFYASLICAVTLFLRILLRSDVTAAARDLGHVSFVSTSPKEMIPFENPT